jgi:hypothetical protein
MDHVDLPDDALESVDALVAKSDGPHYLWATVHFVLNAKRRASRRHKLKPSSLTGRVLAPESAFSAESLEQHIGWNCPILNRLNVPLNETVVPAWGRFLPLAVGATDV